MQVGGVLKVGNSQDEAGPTIRETDETREEVWQGANIGYERQAKTREVILGRGLKCGCSAQALGMGSRGEVQTAGR